MESYIDDDVTDEDGNLVVRNNWKLASVYEDRGGWRTNDGDFDSSCDRDRDEILTQPGGTSTQNIAAFRSDFLTWSFKYLSVREIDPSRSEQPEPPVDEEPVPAQEIPEENGGEQSGLQKIIANKIAEKHVDGSAQIESIQFSARKMQNTADGKLVVAIVRGNDIIAYTELGTEGIVKSRYTQPIATFEEPVQVQGGFDVVIAHIGVGRILAGNVVIVAPA
jgi:hypothetical protein